MNIQAGKILVSTDAMEDLNFKKSIILIARHDGDGTIGFVINKSFGRNLNELEEFKLSAPFPLHDGGPVYREHLFFIHRCNPLIPNGSLISDNIFFGGDFSQAVSLIGNGTLNSSHIKIFVGYCGWDSNELESEIVEGSWTITEDNNDRLFETAP
jgi:putative transcriptional regulator